MFILLEIMNKRKGGRQWWKGGKQEKRKKPKVEDDDYSERKAVGDAENSTRAADRYNREGGRHVVDRRKEKDGPHAGSYANEVRKVYGCPVDQTTLPRKTKCALLLGYSGSAYFGLQMNPGCKTIEAELEKALYLVGAIADVNFGNPSKVCWTRCGRTDKGVHAAMQIVSLKTCVAEGGEQELVARLNTVLPPDIQVFDIIKVTGGFNAKNSCTKRRYEYLLPTFLLAPKSTSTQWFQPAGRGTGAAAAATAAAATAAAATAAAAAAAAATAAAAAAAAAVAADSSSMEVEEKTQGAAAPEAKGGEKETKKEEGKEEKKKEEEKKEDEKKEGEKKEDEKDGGGGDADAAAAAAAAAVPWWEREARGREAAWRANEEHAVRYPASLQYGSGYRASQMSVFRPELTYRMPPGQLESLRSSLALYEGTHNFHNFTVKLKPTDGGARRYIHSFVSSEPYVSHGVEWVRLTVTGQSFLLHHIRKMIGMVIEVVRGEAASSVITEAMTEQKLDVPTAPATGLYLDKPFFEFYNQQFGKERKTLEFDQPGVLAAVEELKRRAIHGHVILQLVVARPFASWLDGLNRRGGGEGEVSSVAGAGYNPYIPRPYEEWLALKRAYFAAKEANYAAAQAQAQAMGGGVGTTAEGTDTAGGGGGGSGTFIGGGGNSCGIVRSGICQRHRGGGVGGGEERGINQHS